MVLQRPDHLKLLVDCLYSDKTKFAELYQVATRLTSRYFGKKRELFNPIYVSDICLADCPYCGYRVSNKGVSRRTLKPYESIEEGIFLKHRGVKNILVVAGDYKHSKYVEMLSQNIKAIKNGVQPNWLGIEVATLEIDEYLILREAGAESVTVFQETYSRSRYTELHQNPQYKGDFDFRYHAQERAIKAGFGEVGFGVLYGIGFFKEDTIAMAEHAMSIARKYPGIKFRFSFPRLQTSEGQTDNCQTEIIGDEDLLKAIVAIRLAFPEASLVLTGRESVDFLVRHASIVNVLGYSGSTTVGGYKLKLNGLSQFDLDQSGSLEAFKESLIMSGYAYC